MSRGVEGRSVAWQVWLHFHTDEHMGQPVAFEHQCGSLGGLGNDLANVMCPGCRFELSHPESECTPLYARQDKR